MLPSHTPLFLGGTEDLSNLPSGAVAGLPVPFAGCVRRLWLNWRSLPLDSQFIINARNIHDCDGTACGGDVCLNGGSCWVSPDNKPVCTCSEHYSGDRCENVVSCDLVGCAHKGRCVTRGKTKSCTCPIGWTGNFCEQEVGHGAPHFGGNSYLVVDSKRAKREDNEDQWAPNALYAKPQGETAISYLFVNFSTAQPDGLLLWTSKSDDFLGIGVETGMVKIVWGKTAMDKNELVLPGTSVADGSWHTLTISYHNRAINFWADKAAPHTVFSNTSLLSDGVFYVGGFPNGQTVVDETSGSFHTLFNGCVQEIIFNDLNFIADFFKYDGENLGSCDLMYP
ncbi:Laminin G domain [Nesidiocoris tenuis]|uniref:Laminin G domain n=1 Tax=Nesidiocoris tenuis TaxID=355587 RepID=A0ABN7AB89_9HEMI|nr:Laminin G domain [Nesidiocoris tenuis]